MYAPDTFVPGIVSLNLYFKVGFTRIRDRLGRWLQVKLGSIDMIIREHSLSCETVHVVLQVNET